jgi:Ca2+-binding RTX toxin-like protein
LNNINVIVGSEHNDTFSLATTSATDVDYVVIPGEGDDSISIASGTSVIVSYERADDPLHITLDSSGTTVFTDPWGGTDTIDGNAAIEGTEHGDTITGNDQNNLFIASEGSDYYDGAGGTDEIDYFGLGDQNESGVEAVAQASGSDTGYAVHENGDSIDTLVGIEDIEGTDFNDTLKGDMNSSDGHFDVTLEGAGGDDYLVDGYGDDSLVGDDGKDTFYLTEGNDSIDGGDGVDDLDVSGLSGAINVDMISSSFSYTIAGSTFSGEIDGIENIVGTDYSDTIILNISDNSVFGNAGSDSLQGNDGNDSLYGGIGDDTLNGGNHDDYLYGNTGTDSLIGGTGSDTFYFHDLNEGCDTIQDFNVSENDKIVLYSQSNDSQTFNFGYTSSQYLDASDFERVESSTDSTYQGDAGTSGNAEMVLFCYIGDPSTYQLIYDPDGSDSDTGTVIAQFSADPGTDFDNNDIYVEVQNAA